ncbi:MAG TPA: alpha/beta fold hydrolase [Paraburkholderia sp.]|jgi:3-oxoadipate enol-lactonase|nr:alpha/beta fold hydrolase [Paraburkholderia sp.]
MQVTVNGIDTRYVLDDESGGPWLTFIHQLGGDLSVWDQLAGHFRHQYTVMRYDLRGHGSTALSARPFAIADLADDLNTLLDALGASKTHLVGLSIGGMVAQAFALAHPSRLLSLTLADTASRTAPDARATWDQRAATVRQQGIEKLADATLDRWLTPDFRRQHPEAVEPIREVLLRTPAQGYAMACEAIRDFDVHDQLRELRTRTLAVAGRLDAGTPPAATKAMADAIEDARFELLDTAHLAPVEGSRRFAALLETFLRSPV